MKRNSYIQDVYYRIKHKRFFKFILVLMALFAMLSLILLILPVHIDPLVKRMAGINLICIFSFLVVFLMDITSNRKTIILPLPLTLKDWFFLGELLLIVTFLYCSGYIVLSLLGMDFGKPPVEFDIR